MKIQGYNSHAFHVFTQKITVTSGRFSTTFWSFWVYKKYSPDYEYICTITDDLDAVPAHVHVHGHIAPV